MTATRAGISKARPTKGLGAESGISSQLWKHVGELAASSAYLLYLSDVASERLSLSQAAFFMLAATADAAGRPATRTQLIQAHGDHFGGSVRNTYRQLLEPSRVFPKALGWLVTEENPDDSREQFLRLSDRGRSVVEGALLALEPINIRRSRENTQ